MTLGIAWGQQPNRAGEPQPLPLLPLEQAWLATLTAPPAAAAVMDERRVYVAQRDGQLAALDRESGDVMWTRAVETSWPPVVGDGRVYVAERNEIHAFDAETGAPVWRVPADPPVLGALTFDAGWIIALLERGDVAGLRASDGRELWKRRVAEGDRPLSAAVPGERDAFYVAYDAGRILALSLTDGRVIWEQTLPGRLSPPAWAPGRVFVGSTDNFFYALDSDDGSLEWKWRYGGDVIGASADGDVVFVASLDNMIRAVNRGNGNQRWRKDTGTRPVVPPLAFDRLGLVAGISPTLTGFAAKTGEQVGTYTAPGDLEGPPLVDPAPKPFSVGAVVVMRDGRVAGLFPVPMLFREPPATPLAALPGRTLPREQR
jgi:hypothetical protein